MTFDKFDMFDCSIEGVKLKYVETGAPRADWDVNPERGPENDASMLARVQVPICVLAHLGNPRKCGDVCRPSI